MFSRRTIAMHVETDVAQEVLRDVESLHETVRQGFCQWEFRFEICAISCSLQVYYGLANSGS